MAGDGGGGGGGGERYRSWYLSREEVERGSPSRRDGVGAAKEAELRATYCSFIRDVCVRLQLPQLTFATAVLLCHRFYLRQSHAKNEWQTVATVCILLASKMEDTPCPLKDVVTVAYETMYRKNTDAAKRIKQKDVLAKQKALILVGETLLLSTIRFDFNIQHPYEPLNLALKNLGISQKEVRQVANNIINDTLPTTLVVQFKPHYIAAGSLYLAAKSLDIRLPSETGKVWWQQFDVAPKQLQVVIQQMTELFKKRDPCPLGPAMKPTPIPTPTLMEKRQIISTPDPVLRHIQSSRRSMGSDTVASRCAPVGGSICTSARNEENQFVGRDANYSSRHTQPSRRSISNTDDVACRCVPGDESISRSARNEENRALRRHINHSFNTLLVDQRLEKQSIQGAHKADQRFEKQSIQGAHKADHVYHVYSGPRDMSATRIRDLTRKKRRIQEAGGHPAPDKDPWAGSQLRSVIVFETSSWLKKQKLERG